MFEEYDFVTVEEGEGHLFGVGQVTHVSKDYCSITFFDSPGQLEEKIDVPIENLVLADLFEGTRVYHKSGSDWFSGTVVRSDRGTAEIKFDKGLLPTNYLSFAEIKVRRTRGIQSPGLFLAEKIWDTKYLSDRRLDFLQTLQDSYNALDGMTGYFSASIELEKHQYDIVKTVCTSPVQRFLLADEVGLGKTIEACSVIRQYVLDFPVEHIILIIVPDHLVNQWESELKIKFHLGNYLQSSIYIYGYSQRVEISNAASSAGMVVIDEAHNVSRAENRSLYTILLNETKTLPRLLLLSATPAQHNEERFFDMLRLLDPSNYKEGQYEKFKEVLSNAQALNEIISDLTPEAYFFLEDNIGRLLEMFPNDELLQKIGKELIELTNRGTEEDDPILMSVLQKIRDYVQEQYKVDYRILRNRRENIRGLTPERSLFGYLDIYDELRSNFLFCLNELNTRIQFSQLEGEKKQECFYWLGTLKVSFFKREAEEKIYANLVEKPPKIIKEKFEGEWSRATNSFEQLLEKNWNKSIVQIISSYLLQNNIKKAVIFCLDAIAAAEISAQFTPNEKEIATFDIANNGPEEISLFNLHSGFGVLLCGGEVEEGLNLHGSCELIINYDVPLNPNRLEQRIGRVDRYGSGKCSILNVRDTSNEIEVKLHELYCDTLKVYSRSIASLQKSIEKHFGNLIFDIGKDGVAAVEILGETLEGDGGLRTEEKFIKQQELMLALTDRADDSFQRVLELDDNWNNFRKTCQSWLLDCLRFKDTPPYYFFWVAKNELLGSVTDFWNKHSGKQIRWTASGSLNYISKIIEGFATEHSVATIFVPVQKTSEAFKLLRNNQIDLLVTNDTHARKIGVNSGFSKLGDGGVVEGSERKRLILSNSAELSADVVFQNFKSSIDANYSENKVRLGKYWVHTSEYSFRRQTALMAKLQLMTAGSEIIDAVQKSSEAEFLGRCYVNWRASLEFECEAIAEPFVGFQILVEANIEPAIKILEGFGLGQTSNIKEALKKQTAVFLKPSYVSIWVDKNHLYLEDENVIALLNKSYSRNPDAEGHLDQELTPKNLENLFKHLLSNQYESWPQFVLDAEAKALQSDTVRHFISYDLDDLSQKFETQAMERLEHKAHMTGVFSPKEEFLHGLSMDQEMEIIKKLANGIKTPNLLIECVGVQFLSNKKLKA